LRVIDRKKLIKYISWKFQDIGASSSKDIDLWVKSVLTLIATNQFFLLEMSVLTVTKSPSRGHLLIEKRLMRNLKQQLNRLPKRW
jgi:hypothetical protein